MSENEMMSEIKDANLNYLMLAQQMIRADKATAIFRLGISTDIADLLPGDILIVDVGSYLQADGTYHITSPASSGHTSIFTGAQDPYGYTMASASQGQRSGNMGNIPLADNRGKYLRARMTLSD